jgi:hypothetical protein
MNRLAVAVVLLSLLVVVKCSIPNLSKIDLSDCNQQCNTTSKTCFDGVNDAGEVCLSKDAGADASYSAQEAMRQACGEDQTKAGEACVNTLIDCIDQCIAQTEATLKGK